MRSPAGDRSGGHVVERIRRARAWVGRHRPEPHLSGQSLPEGGDDRPVLEPGAVLPTPYISTRYRDESPTVRTLRLLPNGALAVWKQFHDGGGTPLVELGHFGAGVPPLAGASAEQPTPIVQQPQVQFVGATALVVVEPQTDVVVPPGNQPDLQRNVPPRDPLHHDVRQPRDIPLPRRLGCQRPATAREPENPTPVRTPPRRPSPLPAPPPTPTPSALPDRDGHGRPRP